MQEVIDGEKLDQVGSHLGEGARQLVTEGSEKAPWRDKGRVSKQKLNLSCSRIPSAAKGEK